MSDFPLEAMSFIAVAVMLILLGSTVASRLPRELLKIICAFLVALIGSLATTVFLPWFLGAVSGVLLACLVLMCIVIVPHGTGVTVMRLGRQVRSHGPGLLFLCRPFEWLWEEQVSLKRRTISDAIAVPIAEGAITRLDVSMEYEPDPLNLIAFGSWQEKDLQSILKTRLVSSVATAVRERRTFAEVRAELKDIEKETKSELLAYVTGEELLEEHYAIIVKAVTVELPGVSDELV